MTDACRVPGALGVAVNERRANADDGEQSARGDEPDHAEGCLLGEGAATDADTFLRAMERRVVLGVEVDEARVVYARTYSCLIEWSSVFRRPCAVLPHHSPRLCRWRIARAPSL